MGSFGTVKFALSLLESDKINFGEVICIKKTKCLGNKIYNDDEIPVTIKDIVKSTIGDYFIDDVGDIVYAPSVYDM